MQSAGGTSGNHRRVYGVPLGVVSAENLCNGIYGHHDGIMVAAPLPLARSVVRSFLLCSVLKLMYVDHRMPPKMNLFRCLFTDPFFVPLQPPLPPSPFRSFVRDWPNRKGRLRRRRFRDQVSLNATINITLQCWWKCYGLLLLVATSKNALSHLTVGQKS